MDRSSGIPPRKDVSGLLPTDPARISGEEHESRIFLSLGSNLGDRLAHLRSGLDWLHGHGLEILQVSQVYQTEPVGCPPGSPDFLNLAVVARTLLDPAECLQAIQGAENARERTRPVPNAPRSLDVDILLWDDLVLDSPELVVPHPRMATRRFVLVPLVELAPGLRHPILGATVEELLAACPGREIVEWYCKNPWLSP